MLESVVDAAWTCIWRDMWRFIFSEGAKPPIQGIISNKKISTLMTIASDRKVGRLEYRKELTIRYGGGIIKYNLN